MGLNSCYAVLKYLVIFINFIFMVIGLGILGLAIWLLKDPSAYISVTQNEEGYESGIYLLLTVGCLLLFVGLLGCCGACNESQCYLISFFCFLLVVLAGQIACGVWAYTNREDIKRIIKISFEKTIEEEYGIVKSRTITVDTIQQELHCCGANGPHDWANSRYNNKKDKLDLSVSSHLEYFEIPASCCKGDKDDVLCKAGRVGQGTSSISPIIYNEGCLVKVHEYFEGCMPIIIGVSVAIILLEILGLILSLILCCAVRFVDRYKA